MGVFGLLNLNCERASALLSQARDRRLSLAERAALRWHTLCCRACRTFAAQLELLGVAARRSRRAITSPSGVGLPALPADARARIRRALEDALGA